MRVQKIPPQVQELYIIYKWMQYKIGELGSQKSPFFDNKI